MDVPEVHYARSGDVAIAYQVVGEGPVDIVFFRGFAGDLLSTWDQPLLRRHVLGLASFSRVLMLDKRGTGLSDRTTSLPTLETRMDDLRAVMDDARSEAHTDECERVDGKLGGIAVSIGARVASSARAGEILVTSTVRDLVAGSGFAFEERGEHSLKGVPGTWRLYAVADA